MNLYELIHEFLFDCKVRELSEQTVKNYEKQLRVFFSYFVPLYTIEAVFLPECFLMILSYFDKSGKENSPSAFRPQLSHSRFDPKSILVYRSSGTNGTIQSLFRQTVPFVPLFAGRARRMTEVFQSSSRFR